MIAVMPDHVQAQDASVAQFSIEGHVCVIVPSGASETPNGLRIVGSVTLGRRRYAICSNYPNAHFAPADLLTARELQIAVLLAQGFDSKAVGRRLGISPLTVATHRTHAYSKLGVSSRAALAARIAGTVALHRPANPARASEQTLPPT